ncbi:hypothetical protein TWF481_006458 [Arthrobotrys musiformis]|uniref:CFEM domain-containing protein n=1 Tax=Arthrobotrys musiformis TaxID=47236 RepID=A0AAV9WGY7_9PEZI
MKPVQVLSLLGAAATAVYAQDALAPIPECAQTCIQGGLGSSSCNPTDFQCQCTDSQALGTVISCVETRCEPSQIQAIIAAASAICEEYGGIDISTVLTSDGTSTTSSTYPSASSRISSVTGSQKVLPTTTASVHATKTSMAPTSTESPNGAGKTIISSAFGVVVSFATIVFIGL